MLDILLDIIDRLFKLKEYRDERLRRVYQDLLKPAFEQLQSIHLDYLKMFEQAASLLPAADRPPAEGARGEHDAGGYVSRMSDAAEYLRRQRIEFEPVRTRLRSLTKELATARLTPEAAGFVGAVLRYFPTGLARAGGEPPPTPAADVLQAIDYWADAPGPDSGRNLAAVPASRVRLKIDSVLRSLRGNWADVCDTFAALTVATEADRG